MPEPKPNLWAYSVYPNCVRVPALMSSFSDQIDNQTGMFLAFKLDQAYFKVLKPKAQERLLVIVPLVLEPPDGPAPPRPLRQKNKRFLGNL